MQCCPPELREVASLAAASLRECRVIGTATDAPTSSLQRSCTFPIVSVDLPQFSQELPTLRLPHRSPWIGTAMGRLTWSTETRRPTNCTWCDPRAAARPHRWHLAFRHPRQAPFLRWIKTPTANPT